MQELSGGQRAGKRCPAWSRGAGPLLPRQASGDLRHHVEHARGEGKRGILLKSSYRFYDSRRQLDDNWGLYHFQGIPANLDDLLLPTDSEFAQDFYIIGVQEGCPDRYEIFSLISN